LFPWADKYDLNHFLGEGVDTYKFEDVFSGVSPGSALSAMCTQMAEIASALNWLHENIQVKRKHVPLAHLDLKPDNILIDTNTNSIVGKWLLTDFGISAFQEKDKGGHSKVFSIRDYVDAKWTMRVDPPREFGTYQPPEVNRLEPMSSGRSDQTLDRHVGRSGDIWSFGCIFAEVLAFSMGGRRAVNSFKEARMSGTDPRNDYFWSHDGKKYEPRRSMLAWLSKLQDMYPDAYSTGNSVNSSVLAIKFILKAKSQDRPSALKVRDKISDLVGLAAEEEGEAQMARTTTMPGRKESPTQQRPINQSNAVIDWLPRFEFEREGTYPEMAPTTTVIKNAGHNQTSSGSGQSTINHKFVTPQSILDFGQKLRSVGTISCDKKASERTTVSASLCFSGRSLATITKSNDSISSCTLKSYEVSLESRKVGREIRSIPLDQGVTWKNVLVCGDTVAAWGDSSKDEKHV
jgi:serine/threonine protein kinase